MDSIVQSHLQSISSKLNQTLLQKQTEAERNLSKEMRPLTNQLMLSQTRLDKVEGMFKRLTVLESQIHTKVEVATFDHLQERVMNEYVPVSAFQKFADEISPRIDFAL